MPVPEIDTTAAVGHSVTPRIDQTAPWQLAESLTRRHPDGRYRVDAEFMNRDRERKAVTFWLRSEADSFAAYCAIVNSRLDPAGFEGALLP